MWFCCRVVFFLPTRSDELVLAYIADVLDARSLRVACGDAVLNGAWTFCRKPGLSDATKWLNRRSQSRSMTWTQLMCRLPGWELRCQKWWKFRSILDCTKPPNLHDEVRNKQYQGQSLLELRVLREARCGSSARRDLRGGHRATRVPTSIC